GGPQPAFDAARAGDFDQFVWTSCPHFPREGRGRNLEEGKLTVRFGGLICNRRFAVDKCRLGPPRAFHGLECILTLLEHLPIPTPTPTPVPVPRAPTRYPEVGGTQPGCAQETAPTASITRIDCQRPWWNRASTVSDSKIT